MLNFMLFADVEGIALNSLLCLTNKLYALVRSTVNITVFVYKESPQGVFTSILQHTAHYFAWM